MAPSEQERRIARVIEEYDLQGWHRSGTEVDGASARWLADRVAGCGLEPTLESAPPRGCLTLVRPSITLPITRILGLGKFSNGHRRLDGCF